ncbi:MAG: hypothetical protein Q9170_004715 [Blastenia crenularia]
MPPAGKRRRTDGIIAPSTQRSIQAFGKVSKSQLGRSPAGKSKAKAERKVQPAVCVTLPSEEAVAGRKRAAQHFEEECATEESNPRAGIQGVKEDGDEDSILRPRKSSRGRPSLKTPRRATRSKPASIETPTKGARSYLESLDLSSSSPTPSRFSSSPTPRDDTPASSPPPAISPTNVREPASELPEELQDLINLHSSFLTALSLHYAHHGALAPVDFRALRPNIERAWRKRRVSIQDIQQLLALQESSPTSPSRLSLSDFGSSKICIELEALSENSTTHKQPLNEDLLNKIFSANLTNQWTAFSLSHQDSPPIEDFIRSLPLTPIHLCTSTTALAPLLLKGQRRLEDLKAGAIRAQARTQPKAASKTTTNNPSSGTENIPPTAKPPSTQARKTSLLDRIKQKQEAHIRSTALCAPLTSAQIQRKAALRRIEEIVPVIEFLSPSNGVLGVKTYTMATVVQHLQMSLRNPIEKEVAVRAVRLLAEEVAPGWIGVREVGKVVGVTVRKGGVGCRREDVGKKVKELVNGL